MSNFFPGFPPISCIVTSGCANHISAQTSHTTYHKSLPLRPNKYTKEIWTLNPSRSATFVSLVSALAHFPHKCVTHPLKSFSPLPSFSSLMSCVLGSLPSSIALKATEIRKREAIKSEQGKRRRAGKEGRAKQGRRKRRKNIKA